ncbi:MAG: hypothetical protein RJA70_3557, partial [Pseudomonadota bacterium]
MLLGCGEDAFDSDACAELPQYDIRPSKEQLDKAEMSKKPLP